MEKKIKAHELKQRMGQRVEKVCEICGKTVKGKDHYKTHLKSHLRHKAIEQGDEAGIENLFFYCDKCGKRLSGRSGLRDGFISQFFQIYFLIWD